MSISIYDVAREAGVSIATVSRYINGYEGIKPLKKKAIDLAMQKLVYVPNQTARSLATSATEMIGLVGPMITLQHSYMSEYVKGALKYTENTRYSLVLISSGLSMADACSKPLRFMEYVQQNRVDGLLLITKGRPDFYEPHYQYLLEKHIPLTYIGYPLERTIPCPSVFSAYARFDHYVYDVMLEFIRLGHTRIAVLLMQNENDEVCFAKLSEALRRETNTGFEVFVSLQNSGDDGESICQPVLDNTCSAVFAANLSLVHKMVTFLSAQGFSIPEDVSVVSVEYKEGEGAELRPAIDCVYVPSLEIGYHSAGFLCNYLNHEQDLELDLTLPCKRIRRGSTKEHSTALSLK